MYVNIYIVKGNIKEISFLSKRRISTYTNDVEIKGVLLTSNTATRPLYCSSPSLYDTANLSPEASHAIFSTTWLQNNNDKKLMKPFKIDLWNRIKEIARKEKELAMV